MSDKGLDASPNNAVLVERNGRFFIYEPRLGVIASDESIERAYEKFVGTRRDYVEEVARAGLTASSPTPSVQATPVLAGRSMSSELRLFVAKTCIVLLIIAGLAGVAIMGMQQAIAGLAMAVAPLGKISLVDVVGKVEAMAIDARDLPEDRKELLRRSIGELSREIAPVIDAWRNPSNPAAPPSEPGTSPAPNNPRQ